MKYTAHILCLEHHNIVYVVYCSDCIFTTPLYCILSARYTVRYDTIM